MMAKSIATNSIFNFALKFFRIIVPLLVSPYIVRLFAPELFGAFNDATTWLDFALIFGIFGIYTYGIREIAGVRDDLQKSRKLFSSLFAIGLCTNLVVLIAYVGVVWFSVGEMTRMIYLVLGGKIFANIFMVEWFNEALESYRFITIKTVLVRIIYVACIFLFIRKPDDVVTYAVVIVATDLLNNLISFLYVNRRVSLNFRDIEIKRHLMPLIGILVISNVNLLYSQFDRMLLGRVDETMVSVTLYKNPQDIMYLISSLIASIVMVALPRLAYLNSKGAHEEYMSLLNKSYHSFMMVVFPACLGIACLAPEIIWIYSGDKYPGSIPVLVIFAIRTLESSVYTICANQVLYVKHQEKFLVRILLFCGLLNVVFNSILVAVGFFTPVTAIASTLLAEIILMVVIFRFIRKKLGIPFTFFNRTNVKYLLLALCFIPISWGLKLLGFHVIFNCFLIIPACMLFYFGTLLLIKDPTMLFLTQKVLGKFLPKRKQS